MVNKLSFIKISKIQTINIFINVIENQVDIQYLVKKCDVVFHQKFNKINENDIISHVVRLK